MVGGGVAGLADQTVAGAGRRGGKGGSQPRQKRREGGEAGLGRRCVMAGKTFAAPFVGFCPKKPRRNINSPKCIKELFGTLAGDILPEVYFLNITLNGM